MLDHRLDQVGAHLDLADARLGLGVGDAEARAVAVVESDVSDLQVAQLADADAGAAKDLADHPATDVAAPYVGVNLAHVETDRRLGHAELARDLVWPVALGEHPGHHRSGDAKLRGNDSLAERVVLLGRRVEQRRQLVHLQERPAGLRDPHAHPLRARGIRLDVAVLDRVIHQCGESADQLAHRRRPERDQTAAPVVTEVRARRDGLAQLARLGELVGLERETEVAVDLIEPQMAEVRVQVAAEPPAVVGGGAAGDRLVAVDPVDLGLQPDRRVVGEERHAGCVHRGDRRRQFGPLPQTDPHQGEDVAQLGARASLVPSAAATTQTAGPLVERDGLPPTVRTEAERKGSRPIRELLGVDRPLGRTWHSDHPPSGLSTVRLGHRESPPGVLAGGRCTVPRPLCKCSDSTRGRGRRRRRIGGLGQPLGQRLAVESKPAARTAQADATELHCVLVDPIPLHAEKPRNVGGIDKPRIPLSVFAWPHKLRDSLGDLLDVVGIELH